jgi:alkanesulfonate monooxygenase SsuD/methylene tetrahydromethanopterin reductase-like flavin-dependent oxidoreductase (luciferase family)
MTAAGVQPRRSLVFATEALEALPELARRAERAGLHRVWTTEYLHRDAVARALAVALGTERIGVGTGIAYAFTRLPLAMAALAADVQRLAGGRFALGISSGTRGVRRWYGTEFEPPARRIAAYADALREAWSRDAGLDRPPPILAASLNPVMTRWAAQSCDGVLLHALAIGRLHLHERVLPAFARGRENREGGGPLELAAWCITSIDEDEERARSLARRQLAFYFSTPSYASVAAGTVWEGVPGAVRAAFEQGGRTARWSELAALVSDAVVDELTISGTPASARERADALGAELAGLGVTELVFQTVGAEVPDEEVVANCEQIIDVLGASAPANSATTGGSPCPPP